MKENPDLGILLLRIGLAAVFIVHGYLKLSNMEGTISFFGMLGFPAVLAWAVAIIEVVGGVAMLLGVYTRYAGWALAIIMAVAIAQVKWSKGFAGGYEFEAMLLLASLAAAYIAPGKYRVMKK
jgi:putative oxidoreductase